MRKLRLNIETCALLWFIFLSAVAVVLPPLGFDVRPSRWVTIPMLVFGTALMAFTAAAMFRYFVDSWSRLRTVPNKAIYTVWLGFESAAAVVVLVLLVYGIVRR